MNAESLLHAVADAATLAGATALRAWRTGLAVESKGDGSPVTEADRAAERAVRAWIEERFPHDGILGEEFGVTRPEATRRWLIDPIDGTKSFVRGVPLWGSLVAVVEGGEVLAGAAAYPAVGESLAAARGAGCFHDGARAAVSAVATLAEATALTTDPRFDAAPDCRARWEALAATVAVSRSWGDCYGYLLVATGRAEIMTDGAFSPWDAAAFVPIIEEAGGVFTDWDGRRGTFGRGGIATNAALADAVRAQLAGRSA